jgi:aryl-alcohol dehydrogenase-like predicted oxidoreductase
MKTTLPGKTGSEVSVVGMGGEDVLRSYKMDKEAQSVIREALQQGITYIDCARVYSDSELH